MPVSTTYNLTLSLALAVGASTPQLARDPFYTKHLDAAGIPILASARTPDEALAVAREIVVAMLAHRPDLTRYLVARSYRVAVMAADETTTDLPEQPSGRSPHPTTRASPAASANIMRSASGDCPTGNTGTRAPAAWPGR